ncbi:SRPBCC family protein [Aureisphaera sp. CAU 1614]|uniref:SRPBCC family protein n=1 Tax=Halomarinibacterium sedimenti TaxID=2857106 RepID=A0A9X1FPA6_9FLAO|nr:SRPBCC family protein [Halomarinibacterium sedimenti]MBW2938055.1 SRPBCC family protein [Halomarinibacterium sedimenti]
MGKITVKTSIKGDINKVWDYWTKPEHIIHWNFASDEWCCPKAENDLKPNGKFSYRMEAKDGSMGFDFDGIYDKVIDKKHISCQLGDGRKVDINFTQSGNEIHISESFDAEEINTEELQRTGWQAILGNFKKYVESK